jgi:AraC family transcriptional regulator
MTGQKPSVALATMLRPAAASRMRRPVSQQASIADLPPSVRPFGTRNICPHQEHRTLDARKLCNHLAVYPHDNHPEVKMVIAQTLPRRVDLLKWLTVRSETADDIVISHMLRKGPDHGMTEPQARVASYAACVHLDSLDSYDVWCDDQHISSRPLSAGTMHISDMRHTWRADIRSAFNVMNFYIPQSALDKIADEQDIARVEELHCPIGLAHVDTVFHNLALALLPALAVSEKTNRLFTDCACRAVISHLVRMYGSPQSQSQHVRGGLAPWQRRRAKESLMANFSGETRLEELAKACRLSPSHFCRAFSRTFGFPPYRWLMIQRVERAKELILNTDQSMVEIGMTVGFADQSHFTRAFSRRVGASPAAWRRAQKK